MWKYLRSKKTTIFDLMIILLTVLSVGYCSVRIHIYEGDELCQFYVTPQASITKCLKGHGNEADFLGFLQKLGPHRSLTVPFEPFRFWLRIPGVIKKRLPDSLSQGVGESGSHWLSDSAFECLKEKLGESESRRLPDSANRGATNYPTRRVGESSWWVGESLFEFFKI